MKIKNDHWNRPPDPAFRTMTDFDSIWRTQDEIRTVVNAVLGECDTRGTVPFVTFSQGNKIQSRLAEDCNARNACNEGKKNFKLKFRIQ